MAVPIRFTDHAVNPGVAPVPSAELPASATASARDRGASAPPSVEQVYRHRLPVRISHWLNVPVLIILIMSGLQIFNAHPALYWGDRSDRHRPLLSIRPVQTDSGDIKGITTLLGHQFDTTGVLGYSNGMSRGFPAWATIPSGKWLAMGRQWHLFFAWLFVVNGLIFTAYALASRHATRDLAPTGKDWRGIGNAIKDHLLLRHPSGNEAKRYNVLQKLAYATILFIVAPLIVLTGLAMSPTIDTAFPWLLTLFGGRQAARTIHFIACFSFVGFIGIHVLQVVLTGFRNNIRSMVTGWFTVRHEGVSHEA
ncbi:MAG: cytochrome b/b6 domain-containing protein [Nitrospiraceae bacterium]|uniref:cytochrome b/b6 domain-containing protein n=1 Tax=Nitrospira cf. moscoviensis SBR1015 TaxID=96242 RepID=UPI000B3BCE78|nr:cytochrome b/b6 domain-containing protein [Nitrospira cf. moscoviensis SBR1015]MBY0248181.1 cytochrome b/b6 domain-containing protein [Nitrospiraceae bacterium]